MKIRVAVIAAAITLSFGLGVPHQARASSIIGSIEPTQLANNIELIMAYVEQVQQTSNQIKQYQAQLKSLQQMDSRKLGDMLLGVGGELAGEDVMRRVEQVRELDGRLRSLSDNMTSIAREGRVAVDVVEELRSVGVQISGEDYLGAMRALANIKQDTYAERMKRLDGAMKDAQSDIQRVNQIAAMAPQIETHVEGFGALVQTNAIMSSQLAGLQQAVVASSQAQLEAAQTLTDDKAERDIKKLLSDEWQSQNMLPGANQ